MFKLGKRALGIIVIALSVVLISSLVISELRTNFLSAREDNKSAPAAKDSLPVGTIIAYAGSAEEVPKNWLLCDGAEYRKNGKYKKLFSVIGTNYGMAEKKANFKVPDLRGRAIIGAGRGTGLQERILGNNYGQEKVKREVAEHYHAGPAHRHGWLFEDFGSGMGFRTDGDFEAGVMWEGFGNLVFGFFEWEPSILQKFVTDRGNSNDLTGPPESASAGSIEVIQPSLAINYIIKAK